MPLWPIKVVLVSKRSKYRFGISVYVITINIITNWMILLIMIICNISLICFSHLHTFEIVDLWHLSKIQLQTDAQKRNLPLPTYSCEHDGPAHISRFKCKVNLDGRTFESPDCYSTLKDAEDAAARIALLAMSTTGDQEQKGTPNISTNVSSRVNAPLLPKRVNIGRVIILVPA
ncbi:hypothetical protein SAY86_012823 [Trapa natans]|uniref:DRBM domain-containing protein n=1 Tax=Trapa natans TaxID=22666 RepID=A0AAN7LYJ0_TRANT|nr:hypothetical protein SAY86_012823 [Trapa natans]